MTHPLTLALLSLSLLSGAAQAASAGTGPAIDKLFAAWNSKQKPGAVLAVIRDGKVIHRGAYGMADIERAMPNQALTSFHVASVSKQFTAFAVHLLAQDGKLDLDDDIRKHLPELHDFGATITIRHLIHHTSGLRDQWNLLALAGWRLEDVITEDDVMGLVNRQKQLNFAPGKEFLYCNTGYTLLGVIVKRIAGKSLGAFSRERIFDPLGMKHTRFQDNYRSLVQRRASSYHLGAGGKYDYVALSYSNVGATSLHTTVDDLARWDRNFYDAKVGGKDLLSRWQKKGRLTSGREIDYAGGLQVGTYRGADIVEHGGGDAGFRSFVLRFPTQRTSVLLLSNAGDLNPAEMAHKVADLVLARELDPLPAVTDVKKNKVEVKLDSSRLDAFVGSYALSPDFVITFTREHDQLMTQATGQPKFPVYASAERTFFLKVVDAQFVFDAPGPDGLIGGGTLHQNGRALPALRIAASPALSGPELAQREGLFYSEELGVLYTIKQQDGKLLLQHPRGVLPLAQLSPTTFQADFTIGKVEYDCDAALACNSFTVNNGRVRHLLFSKVRINQVGPRSALGGVARSVSKVTPFAAAPVYLRGSMNQWGIANPLQAAGAGKMTVKLMLERGPHEFKIGSQDFQLVDFGGTFSAAALTLNAPMKMESLGANIKLDVPERAEYLFALDVSNADVPVLTVTR